MQCQRRGHQPGGHLCGPGDLAKCRRSGGQVTTASFVNPVDAVHMCEGMHVLWLAKEGTHSGPRWGRGRP